MVTEWARARGAGREGTPVLSVVTDGGSTRSGSLRNVTNAPPKKAIEAAA